MLAVRYVTLAALVIWLGGMVTLTFFSSPSAEELRRFQSVAYVCGVVVFVCLFVIKFVGPPPHHVFHRAGLVAVMIAVALYGGMSPHAASMSMRIDIALGFVLLFWYVRE
jgi:hypothetical protein